MKRKSTSPPKRSSSGSKSEKTTKPAKTMIKDSTVKKDKAVLNAKTKLAGTHEMPNKNKKISLPTNICRSSSSSESKILPMKRKKMETIVGNKLFKEEKKSLQPEEESKSVPPAN